MNLYTKIYEAVDTGIQKALIINDTQDNDVSINWLNRTITADADMLGQYVYELLNSDEPEYYYSLIQLHYKNNGKKYIVNDFKELSQIYHKICLFKTVDFKCMDWLDAYNAVTFILEDMTEIPFMHNAENVAFVKFKNTYIGHDIILHKNLKVSKSQMKWKENKRYAYFNYNEVILEYKAFNDYNGYEHTYIDSNSQDGRFPAFEYCQKQTLNKYIGYLPAIGEISFCILDADLINFIFGEAGCEHEITKAGFELLWSSSEASQTGVWTYMYDSLDICSKSEFLKFAMPFFKLNN